MTGYDPVFDSAWHKWGWAIRHAEALQNDLANYADTQHLFTIGHEYHPKFHCFILRVDKIIAPPPRFGLRVGDFVYCERSCLDHIAWALVMQGRTPNLPPGKLKNVYFPICGSRTGFNKAIKTKLPGVRRADLAIVRRCQPYAAGQRAMSRHCLTTLAELSNLDKHREIQPVWTVPDVAVYNITGHGCEIRRVGPGRQIGKTLQVGTELARIYVRKSGAEPDIHVECELTGNPAINDRFPLEDWLNKTIQFVERLLFQFSDPPEEIKPLVTGAIRPL